jgi:hypothetical protein
MMPLAAVFSLLTLTGVLGAVPLTFADESETNTKQELGQENSGGKESENGNCAQNVISSRQANITCLARAGAGDGDGLSPEIPELPPEESPRDVTIAIQARVISVSDTDNVLDQEVEVGDIITGKYMYSTSTMDSNDLDSTVGDYHHNTEPYGIFLEIGSLVFQTDPNNVDFLLELVNRESDHYLLRSYNNLPLSNGVLVEHISWQLDDFTA